MSKTWLTLREFDVSSFKLSAYRLRWSLDGRFLFFAASREGVAGIYRQPLTGGKAERVIEFEEDDVYDFGYSPDGQQLAVTRGDYQFDSVTERTQPAAVMSPIKVRVG